MDVVWLRLNSIVDVRTSTLAIDDNNESYFMFGPTGIVRFEREYGSKHVTNLYNSNKALVAQVSEDPEFIMEHIRRIRGTGEKIRKKKESKRKASSSKK